MEIVNIIHGCTGIPQPLKPDTHYTFILFRTPVIITVGGSEYRMTKSSAILISPETQWILRSMRKASPKSDLVELSLTPSDKQELLSIGLSPDTPIEICGDFVISSLISCMKLHAVRTDSLSGNFFTMTMSAVFEVLRTEIHTCGQSADKHRIAHLTKLKRLRENIYEEPVRQWSASECAAEIGISREYFHRLYLSAFGVTFLHDTIESRLMYASELLETTNLSITAIAEKCGYDSDSYFMRQFKKHRGCTPTQFRNTK